MNSHKQVGLFMAIFGFVVFMITTYTPLIGIGLIILGAVVFIVGFKLEKNEKK